MSRALRKFDKLLEEAAIAFTMMPEMVEKGLVPAGELESGNARLMADLRQAAAGAAKKGEGQQVSQRLANAENHPQFRGDDSGPWSAFVTELVSHVK